MLNDKLTAGIVKYTKITQWLIPLLMIVPFLGFLVAHDSAFFRSELTGIILEWFLLLLLGGFLISIPFVFIEHPKSGFRCLATAAASFLVFIFISQYPMTREHDGCLCGLRRSWHPWRGHKLKFTIEKEGNPSHQHQIWDPQFEISPYTPW